MKPPYQPPLLTPKVRPEGQLDVFVRVDGYLLDKLVGTARDPQEAAAKIAVALGVQVKLEPCRQGWWSPKLIGPIDEWTATNARGAVGYVAPSGRYAAWGG